MILPGTSTGGSRPMILAGQLQDRAVVDKMAEFLTVNERTQPPEELSDLAARRPHNRLDWRPWTCVPDS